MKKAIIMTLILVLVLTTGIVIASLAKTSKNSIPPFANQSWIRYDSDEEHLSFSSEGEFSYWCSCGNPVDNADMCETYTYNPKSKTITLNCYGPNEKIKVIKHTKDTLVLKFDKETRTFTNAKYLDNEEEE
ncbi:MAG: hypothetical protein ACI4OP_00365 [Candidatus Coprovivens sp.]